MKRIIVLLFALMFAVPMIAQEKHINVPQCASEPVDGAVFKLFPTSNMWTFLKLNTSTGQIWRVQFSVQGSDYRFEDFVSYEKLVSSTEEKNGRFTLYATENIYNFLLLDQIDGRCWQVQWGNSPVIIRIY